MSRARTVLLVAVLALATHAHAEPNKLRRGVSLGLFSEDAGWSYAPLLDEIAKLGATDVELVVPLYQEDVAAVEVGYHPRFSPPLETVRRTIKQAHARGLKVLVFPILRMARTHAPGEWRGTLRPRDRAAWFASYTVRLAELASLAEAEHVRALAIGSELSTLDVDRAPWVPLVAAVRARYHGELVYSANWDHFEAVSLWALVDQIGVCAYFPIAQRLGAPPTDADLVAAWAAPRERLAALSAGLSRPVLLTELGYRSQPGALAAPWDEGASVPADAAAHEAQRRAYAAFRAAFAVDSPWLAGYYVWNWYGWGGAGSRSYTPRGKPAQHEVEQLLRAR